jgi:DNA-binding MarR family transcriptional regulator
MITTRRLNNLREIRKHGIGRLLLLSRRDFLTRLSEKMEATGGPAQVWSRGRLLPYIDLEGTRSTELAKRLGVSKQAVGRVVRELEEDGLLARALDEADGRAFLVTFTESGLEYLMRMHDAIRKVERDYEREFGADAIRALKATLKAIAYPPDGRP